MSALQISTEISTTVENLLALLEDGREGDGNHSTPKYGFQEGPGNFQNPGRSGALSASCGRIQAPTGGKKTPSLRLEGFDLDRQVREDESDSFVPNIA
jgi:hypothetical protein